MAELLDQVGPVDHGCVAIASSPDPVDAGIHLVVLARAVPGVAVTLLCRAVPEVATSEDGPEPIAVASPARVIGRQR